MLSFKRVFTDGKTHPFDTVKWKTVDAVLKAADGKVVFELKGVEAPEFWSDRAVNIVAEKYFRMINGVKETSVKQLVERVASTIAAQGVIQGLFEGASAAVFREEMEYMLLHQMFAFNSPVWFNIGVPGVRQQASACFINSVEDTMESITTLAQTEVMLFKGGSGAGSNLSKLRSSYEKLSGGGSPSGPVSFMKMLDAGAGVTKSGGTTRRAALMRVLNVDHPDILEQANGEPGFIRCKAHAEKIAQALINEGFSAEFNKAGNAYDLVPFQNANNSVRVTDFFMKKVVEDQQFKTLSRTTGQPVHTYKARDLWNEIAQAAWASGDPGVQFDTTTNEWHTLPNTDRINASNPCSEFLHLDDTSCNLGSFNLVKFHDMALGKFRVDDFIHAVEVFITAMEILVGYAEYPDEKITIRTRASRPLGIGYANLGSLLMLNGMAYDSAKGRNFAAAITSVMTGVGYAQSAKMAECVGAFEYFAANKDAMCNVMAKHRKAHQALALKSRGEFSDIIEAGFKAWDDGLVREKHTGYRNSQISVLAPTGTIGFMMDCETTGVEPMLALVQYKKLVGGGYMKLANRSIPHALKALGYDEARIQTAIKELEEKDAMTLPPEHAAVFQTAIGANQVSVDGHLEMMAAVQPFLSGGISKTVNMPNSATVEDVAETYMKAWELGLKCVAIYRDGCKASQPASAKKEEKVEVRTEEAKPKTLKWGERKRLPDDRMSWTHKFTVGGQDGYFHVGLYEDGTPGEVFINISKAGSTLHGLVDMAATAISVGLQHGVPLHTFIDKFQGMRFEPSGFTSNGAIPRTDSLADYFARWLEKKNNEVITGQLTKLLENISIEPVAHKDSPVAKSYHGDPCRSCGNLTMRAGSCWVCTSCGTTTGCG